MTIDGTPWRKDPTREALRLLSSPERWADWSRLAACRRVPPDQREDAVHEAVVAVAEECPKWLADDLPLDVVERRLVLRVGGAIHNWQRRQHRQHMGRESLDEGADLKGCCPS